LATEDGTEQIGLDVNARQTLNLQVVCANLVLATEIMPSVSVRKQVLPLDQCQFCVVDDAILTSTNYLIL
jgi:hypothetical protein